MFNKKYTTKAFIALTALALLSGSCSKKLDQITPVNSFDASNLNPSHIPALALGMYSGYKSLLNYPYLLTDIYSDNLNGVYALVSPYENCAVPPADSYLRDFMQPKYRAIANANIIINLVNDNKLTGYDKYKGEALLMRAYCYLQLANFFGGVIITDGKESNPIRKQNTYQEVIDFAVKDLKEIVDSKLLPSFSKSSEGNMQAAKALLARTYLQMGKNAEAKTLALDVIQNAGGLKLTTAATFAGNFGSTGTETSKEVFWKIQDGPVTYATSSGLYAVLSYWKDAIPASHINALYETSDVRKAMVSSGSVSKFPSDVSPNFPIVRLSEAYLIAAEADARLGVVDVTQYNLVRKNRGATEKLNTDFASPAAFLTEIAAERQREFIAEGLRWDDMKRFGLAIPFLQTKGKTSEFVLMPLPQNELAANSALVQNPGYN